MSENGKKTTISQNGNSRFVIVHINGNFFLRSSNEI